MPPNTVSVARPGRWGNPYRAEVFGRELAVRLFRDSLQGFWSPSNVEGLPAELAAKAYRIHCDMRSRVRNLNMRELAGKNLACWCREGETCHREVLLELANA